MHHTDWHVNLILQMIWIIQIGWTVAKTIFLQFILIIRIGCLVAKRTVQHGIFYDLNHTNWLISCKEGGKVGQSLFENDLDHPD